MGKGERYPDRQDNTRNHIPKARKFIEQGGNTPTTARLYSDVGGVNKTVLPVIPT